MEARKNWTIEYQKTVIQTFITRVNSFLNSFNVNVTQFYWLNKQSVIPVNEEKLIESKIMPAENLLMMQLIIGV